MAQYRPVSTLFWNDPEVEDMAALEKLVYLFLFTNKATTESGIYQISLKRISNECGIQEKKITEIMNNLQNKFRKITFDITTSTVFVHSFLKRNGRGNPNIIKKSILKDFSNNSSLLCWTKFVEIYPLHTSTKEIDLSLLKSNNSSSVTQVLPNTCISNSIISTSNISSSNIIPKHLKDIWPAFEEMRKKIKHPLTNKAIEIAISKLNNLSNDPEIQIKIIEQSIFKSWQGLFPLGDDFKEKPKSSNNHPDISIIKSKLVKKLGPDYNYPENEDYLSWELLYDTHFGG